MGCKIITRDEVTKRSLILPEVLENIPERCECGGEVGFSSDLREAVCLNPKCFYKTAERLGSMAEAMGVAGFDKWTCIRICKEFKLESPFTAFLVESKDRGLNKRLTALKESRSRECSLVEMAEYSGIPVIVDNAETLFRKVASTRVLSERRRTFGNQRGASREQRRVDVRRAGVLYKGTAWQINTE